MFMHSRHISMRSVRCRRTSEVSFSFNTNQPPLNYPSFKHTPSNREKLPIFLNTPYGIQWKILLSDRLYYPKKLRKTYGRF
jgi:hypothetical protein